MYIASSRQATWTFHAVGLIRQARCEVDSRFNKRHELILELPSAQSHKTPMHVLRLAQEEQCRRWWVKCGMAFLRKPSAKQCSHRVRRLYWTHTLLPHPSDLSRLQWAFVGGILEHTVGHVSILLSMAKSHERVEVPPSRKFRRPARFCNARNVGTCHSQVETRARHRRPLDLAAAHRKRE